MASSKPQTYLEGLPENAQDRYRSKLELIGSLDPFTSPLGEPVDLVPPVEACDLVAYLMLQTSCVSKAETFYRTCALPELIGKWYTRPITPNVQNQHDEEVNNTSNSLEYCYCHGPDEGAMIGCDNAACKLKWFHMNCLKIASAPRGKWYCPECRRLPEFSKSRKKRKTL